jgi:hypothetical protein
MPAGKHKWQVIVAALLVGLAVALAVGNHRAAGPIGDIDAENFGWRPNPAGVREFLAELEQPLFRDAGADAIREARGVDTFLYRALYKAHQARYGTPFVCGRQMIGDCVSWGWMHGVWISQSIDWQTGRLPDPPLQPCTESIYGGSRVEARNKPGDGASPYGGWSDGSYGAAAARFVRDWGVVYREPGGPLAVYSGDRAKQWGAYGNGGQGDGGKLDLVAKKHPATHVALVRTWDEAASAIESGFAIPVASDQGFASTTDGQGYAAASGSWQHEMVFCAVRYKANGSPSDALLCLNSWGPRWISYQGKFPEDQPDGSFWVRRETVERMLGQGDSFAVGSVSGFGFRELDNGAFFMPLPEVPQ